MVRHGASCFQRYRVCRAMRSQSWQWSTGWLRLLRCKRSYESFKSPQHQEPPACFKLLSTLTNKVKAKLPLGSQYSEIFRRYALQKKHKKAELDKTRGETMNEKRNGANGTEE